ncbi:MAG: InlB B-repeat-containing protein [Eubacterium sp.]|nr:InlB B-repeat-containing protein [Eubacterium sp.]
MRYKNKNKGGRYIKRVVAGILSVAMGLSLAAGVSDAPASSAAETPTQGDVWVDYDVSVTTTQSETVSLQWAFSIDGDKATNLYVNAVKFQTGATGNQIPKTLKVPNMVTYKNDEYKVVSIGNPNKLNGDSFLSSTITDDMIPSEFEVDAWESTNITKVCSSVLYGRKGVTLTLPLSIKEVGLGVACGSSDNWIYCDAINASYNASGFTGTFDAMTKSSANEEGAYQGAMPEDKEQHFKGHLGVKGTDNHLGSTKLNLQLNGGTILPQGVSKNWIYVYSSSDGSHTVYNDKYVKLDTLPTRAYHSFLGYFSSSDGTGDVLDENNEPKSGNYQYIDEEGKICVFGVGESGNNSNLAVNGEKTLYAAWKPEPVSVTFKANGGSGAISDYAPLYGKTVNLPECTFTKDGYTFTGWATSASGNVVYTDEASVTFKDDMTLYAKWVENSYNITYDANPPAKSESNPSVKMEYQGTVEPQNDVKYSDRNRTNLNNNKFTITGCKFMGWGASPDAETPVGSTVDDALSAVAPEAGKDKYSSRDITLYAIWANGEYWIEYIDEYGKYDNLVRTKTNVDVVFQTRSRPGHEFLGWNRSATETGGYAVADYKVGETGVQNLADIGETIKLYACYTPYTYSIVYHASDGTTTKTQAATYGIATDIIDYSSCAFGVSKAGFNFVGWADTPSPRTIEANETANVIKSIAKFSGTFPQSTTDLTDEKDGVYNLYPVWQRATYKITYLDTTGATPSRTLPTSYVYGSGFTIPTLTKAGKTFTGWVDGNGNAITSVSSTLYGDLTLRATWKDDYIVKMNGSNIQTITCSSGNLVTNGSITSKSFKTGDVITSLSITATTGQLIKSVVVREETTNRVVLSGEYSSPANSVSVSGSYAFTTYNLVVSIGVKPQEYTISYNLDGGSIVGTYPTSYTYGTSVTLPTYVVKTGYTFYGWRNSSGTIITAISATTAGNQTLTAVWEDPNLAYLPSGTIVTPSPNGRYLRLTYTNGKTDEVYLYALGIELKGGSNAVQFKLSDGKTYRTTVSYTAPTEMPSSMKATLSSGGTYATITYPDNSTQSITVNNYSAIQTIYGVRIYFDAKDGRRYSTLIGGEADTDDQDNKSEDDNSGSGNSGNDDTVEPGVDEYYLVGGLSYQIGGSTVSIANPVDWTAKSLTIKATVKIAGKTYKITKIAPEAFYGMGTLKKVVIGKNVKTIGKKAFFKCSKLKKITIKSGDVTKVGKNCFKKIASGATIYIQASKSKYKTLKSKILKTSGCPKVTKFKRI